MMRKERNKTNRQNMRRLKPTRSSGRKIINLTINTSSLMKNFFQGFMPKPALIKNLNMINFLANKNY